MGIKEKVNELKKKYGTNDPFVLCERLGIWVYIVPLGNVHGHYTYTKRKKVFFIKITHVVKNALIKKLSQATNDSVSDYLMQELNKLSDEVNVLKKSLETESEEKKTVAYDIENLKIILDLFDKLEPTFKLTEDINTRRMLLRTILTKVTWDGENYEAELTILDDKKIVPRLTTFSITQCQYSVPASTQSIPSLNI